MTCRYGSVRLTLRTIWNLAWRRSDIERWSDLQNHDPSWDVRTRALASMVPPGTRVLEFGAGRRQLARWLPPDCVYIPSDIVERGDDTFLCDLNAGPLPEFGSPAPDVAVFSGVIEYVIDMRAVAAWLGPRVPMCVLSYNCASPGPTIVSRLKEIRARLGAAWVNHYTEQTLTDLFRDAGYALKEHRTDPTSEGSEQLFAFVQERS